MFFFLTYFTLYNRLIRGSLLNKLWGETIALWLPSLFTSAGFHLVWNSVCVCVPGGGRGVIILWKSRLNIFSLVSEVGKLSLFDTVQHTIFLPIPHPLPFVTNHPQEVRDFTIMFSKLHLEGAKSSKWRQFVSAILKCGEGTLPQKSSLRIFQKCT